MGGEIGSPRTEIRLGRDLLVGLPDAADDALECDEDRNDTALVSLLLAAEAIGVGLECSLVGDVGDGASGWLRA